jgi:hypothetical protein
MNYKQEAYEAFIQSVKKYNRGITPKELNNLQQAFLCGYNMGTIENKEVKYQTAAIIKLKES